MQPTMSETASYKDLVFAINNEMKTNQSQIIWNSFTVMGRTYEPHSVIVGKLSNEELIQMGLMPTVAYDKEHLMYSMYPERDMSTEYHGPHSHNMSVEAMLNLLKFINNPVAIITENEKKRGSGDNEYKCLHFLCTTVEDGEQKYYRAIVHPQSYHNGLLKNGFVSKIITFHEMDEFRFNRMLKDVLDGDRKLLYFNNQEYLRINSDSKPIEFNNYASGSVPIKGHFTIDQNLRQNLQEHRAKLQYAVTVEMNKLIMSKNTRGTSLPLFKSALKTLDCGSTFREIKSARNTINALCAQSNDRGLRLMTQERVDKSFARSYVRILSEEQQANYLVKMSKYLEAMPARDQEDIKSIQETIDKLMRQAPTLKNLGVDFSDRIAETNDIVEARRVSGQFEYALEQRAQEILKAKVNFLYELQKHPQKNGIESPEEPVIPSIGA